MRMCKVIESLERRKAWLGLKLENWTGPLHQGAHGMLNAERVAIEHAIELARAEMERRYALRMDQSEMEAA